MATRTPRTNEPTQEAPHPQADEKPPADSLAFAFTGLHVHLDKIDAQVEALRMEIHGSSHTQAASDTPKVQRRRSLDDMQFALKRLASGEPRPSNDDSPQVLQDAINETIALRQIMQDLMQSSMSIYQQGLSAIRNMTGQ